MIQTADGKSKRNDRFIAVPDHDHRAKNLEDAAIPNVEKIVAAVKEVAYIE